MKRPPPGLRVAIVVAAVACLGLTMCARTPKPPPAAPKKAAPQLEEGKMSKQKPTYFPATKAPGGL